MGLFVFTELLINEAALCKDPSTTSNPDFLRHQYLEGCLDMVGAWFDRFFKIPTPRYQGMTFSFWCQMAHCLMTLFHLSLRDDPAWDRASVRSKLDVFQICDQLCVGFDDVARKRRVNVGPQVEEDIFTKCTRITRLMKQGWQTELSAFEQSMKPGTTGTAGGQASYIDSVTTGPLAVPMAQFMLDDAWLSDIFNVSWE